MYALSLVFYMLDYIESRLAEVLGNANTSDNKINSCLSHSLLFIEKSVFLFSLFLFVGR